MAALFGDSDEEGGVPRRAPAKGAPKVRPFKRPPNMPAALPVAPEFVMAEHSTEHPAAGSPEMRTSTDEGLSLSQPAPPADPPSFAQQQTAAQQAQLPPPPPPPPPASDGSFSASSHPVPVSGAGSSYGPPQHPQDQDAQWQQQGAPQQQSHVHPQPPNAHQPGGFAPQQPFPLLPQQQQIPPPPPMQQARQDQHYDPMRAFLQQPLADFGSPDARMPPPQHGPNYAATGSAASAAGEMQQSFPGASASMARPSVVVEREQLPPMPSMSMSPRRSVSVKALPPVRMTHTPLGQVQIPSMPPVSLPSGPEAPRGNAEDTAAWTAFTDLRKQLEDSHSRTLSLHTEISRMQIAHEKEASALQTSVQAQLDAQTKELQSMTDNYNSATAKLDQLTGILMRKAEELMRTDQKLHQSEVSQVAMAQKVAHVEDRVKLADQARQVAEVRTRELELSLEHATTLLQSLRRQLSVANDEKNNALTEQYNTFEANRQQLIQFYGEREQFMLGSYQESLSNVQLAMQQYLHEREATVEKKWEDTFQTQLDHQKSMHVELVARADRHVEEITKLKSEQEAEKEKAIAHMQREIRLADERNQARVKEMAEDVSRRERELGEREQKMRMNVATAEQDAKLALLTREAEMKAQYDRLLEEARKEYEKDRERLATAYREHLASLSATHIANERELERLHREKEREMAQRYRVANWDDDDRRSHVESTHATSRTQDVLLAKMDKMQADQEARRLATKARFSGTSGAAGEVSALSGAPVTKVSASGRPEMAVSECRSVASN
jgi:hypothetical protein